MRLGAPQDILTRETLGETFGVDAQITETAVNGETVRQITLLRTLDKEDDKA